MKAWKFVDEMPEVGRIIRGRHVCSMQLIDALYDGDGSIVCEVEIDDCPAQDHDQIICRKYEIVAVADATNILHEFGCWCAERALFDERKTDKRSRLGIEAKREWLAGKIDDEELRSAQSRSFNVVSASEEATWVLATGSWAEAAKSAEDAARKEPMRTIHAGYYRYDINPIYRLEQNLYLAEKIQELLDKVRQDLRHTLKSHTSHIES